MTDRDYQQFFMVSALKGSATFLETLVPPAEIPEYDHFDRANSRTFVLLRTLIEAQKSAFAMTRWHKFDKSTDLDRPLEELNGGDRLLLESHVDEQSLWQRKLSEALVLLINFSLTNELQFYYHFLLLHDLFRQGSKVREQTRFFGQPSQTAQARLDSIRTEFDAVENETGDISRCWYMDAKGQNRRNASFSRQLEIALASATPLERTALGYTYLKGFGEASGNIHLNFLRSEHARPYACFASGFASCGMLAMCVLDRAHQLSGVSPSGINEHFINGRDSVGRDGTKNAAAEGDFVLVEGPSLGVVEEVRSGPFGYEAYRVRKVEPSADDEIEWDWFTAFDLTPFQDREGLLEGLQQSMAEYAAQGAELDPPPSEVEMEESIQQAMALMWREGLGEYIAKTAKRNTVEPGPKNTG
ncbi:MAG: hypothetical protein H8E66_04370 [Planctomycetes bacterium]|nr:hypothetical protein [Planctomycetota bacterium]